MRKAIGGFAGVNERVIRRRINQAEEKRDRQSHCQQGQAVCHREWVVDRLAGELK